MNKAWPALAAAATVAALALPASVAQAQPIDNSMVTIVGSAPGFGGYEVQNAIDTGPNSANTDFASQGQGVNAFIDFNLGSPQTLSSITFTDRVTSGGANGGFVGGTGEQNTAFDFILSTNSTFGDADDVIVTGVAPANISGTAASAADFTSTTPIANLTAQFVRFDVTAVEDNPGNETANNGASNFIFTAVPEPAGLSLLALGGFGLLARRRRDA